MKLTMSTGSPPVRARPAAPGRAPPPGLLHLRLLQLQDGGQGGGGGRGGQGRAAQEGRRRRPQLAGKAAVPEFGS